MCKVFDEGMGSAEFATPWLNNRILKLRRVAEQVGEIQLIEC